MKRILLSALFFVAAASIVSVQAQDSKTILDKLSAKTKNYETIYAEYDAVLEDKKNGINETNSGAIRIKGQKYNLDIANYKVICDGENVWTYDKDENFCSIDLLEDMDEDMFDPSKLFSLWEDDFKHEYKGMTKVNGAEAYHINLYPLDPKEKPFHTIEMYINKAKMEVVKVVSKGREGADMIYTVKKFTPNSGVSDSDFTFVESKYPGVDVEANRW